jgi:hypothetical protein
MSAESMLFPASDSGEQEKGLGKRGWNVESNLLTAGGDEWGEKYAGSETRTRTPLWGGGF